MSGFQIGACCKEGSYEEKNIKISLGIFFAFGFCTVTSIRAEEVLVPQVSLVRANYQDEMFSVANLPASCLRTDEQWGKGSLGCPGI